jgi:uncharacterized protein (DUF433 family)
MRVMMQAEHVIANGTTIKQPQLVRELYGGEVYEYYPLGHYIVAAPGVCGGRPTFKYTRIEPGVILGYLAKGHTIEEIVQDYDRPHLTREAVIEAILLAGQSLIELTKIRTFHHD